MSKRKQVAHKPHTKWDMETKQAVITDYASTGSMALTHKHYPQMPVDTVRDVVNSDMGVALIAELHAIKAVEHRQAYSRLVSKSLAKAEQGIEKLDVNSLSANDIKSLVITGATSTDKLRLADGIGKPAPSSGPGNQTISDQLRALSASLIEKEARVVKTIKKDNTNQNENGSH